MQDMPEVPGGRFPDSVGVREGTLSMPGLGIPVVDDGCDADACGATHQPQLTRQAARASYCRSMLLSSFQDGTTRSEGVKLRWSACHVGSSFDLWATTTCKSYCKSFPFRSIGSDCQ